MYTTVANVLHIDTYVYGRQDRGALPMPLDSVHLPRRLCVRLRVLPTYGQMHRMPPANVTPNHPLVSNILPHLAFQVCLYPQPTERVRALGFDPWKWRRRRVELREVCACSGQALERGGGRGWLESYGREGGTRRNG